MKTILKLALVTCAITSSSTNAISFDVDAFLAKTYITLGAAYKIKETELTYVSEIPGDTNRYTMKKRKTIRLEIYYQYNKCIKLGAAHHSQLLSGYPFNNDFEYSKTEIFFDYTRSLAELFKGNFACPS